eukprot:3231066-Rhodomonas_salina.1
MGSGEPGRVNPGVVTGSDSTHGAGPGSSSASGSRTVSTAPFSTSTQRDAEGTHPARDGRALRSALGGA